MRNLAMDFVNTKWYVNHERMSDLFEDQDWFRQWLAKYGHSLDDTFFQTPNLLSTLRELRVFLSNCFDQLNSNNMFSEASLNRLNAYANAYKATYNLVTIDNSYSLIQNVNPLTLEDFIGLLSNSFIRFVVESDLSRFRICDNDECKWLFVDSTKSKTKKWCCNTCASLVKVRKYRAKNS